MPSSPNRPCTLLQLTYRIQVLLQHLLLQRIDHSLFGPEVHDRTTDLKQVLSDVLCRNLVRDMLACFLLND